MLGVMSRLRNAVLVHEGGMRFAATTGTGRTITFGDDTEANELSPVETLAAALAACSAMDVVSVLAKKRQRVSTNRIQVNGEQRDEYPQVYTRIDVTHVVEGTVLLESAVRRAIDLSAERYCPVTAIASAGATEVHRGYRMRGPGASQDRPARPPLRRGSVGRPVDRRLRRECAMARRCRPGIDRRERRIRPPLLDLRRDLAADRPAGSPRPGGAGARIPAALCPGPRQHGPDALPRLVRDRRDRAGLGLRARRRGSPVAPRTDGLLPRLPALLPALVGAGRRDADLDPRPPGRGAERGQDQLPLTVRGAGRGRAFA